ncbi:hypothetical protein ACFRMQ_28235 [Kitasatospora sp. NPDC056783]|uniref:hypothetical protein n=1 Tax=Kitasatospora sp. NPDC056783 TaxID=3345943 RepID=UPI0036995AFA
MKHKTAATVIAATVLLSTGCESTDQSGAVRKPAFAPSAIPSSSGGEAASAEFARHVQEHAPDEQRTAVTGHVTKVLRSVRQGDHRNSYIATDYAQPDDTATRNIVRAYLAWAGPEDDATMLVLYTASGGVMGAIDLADWRGPSPSSR